MPESTHTRARWLLIAGLAAGIVMAAGGVLEDEAALPSQAIARVNDRLILRDAWLRAVAAVSSERRTPLTQTDRRHILERLIDEELLAQHGLALGLVEQDRRLRGQLVQQVLQTAVAGAARPLDEAELRTFHQQNRDFFAPPARLRVAAARIDGKGRRIEFLPPVPDVLLPPAQLRSYLGPGLTRRAMELQPGESSEPQAMGDEHVVVELLEREPGVVPPFEQIREQVEAELRRRGDEEAVRQLLRQLREDHRVLVSGELE